MTAFSYNQYKTTTPLEQHSPRQYQFQINFCVCLICSPLLKLWHEALFLSQNCRYAKCKHLGNNNNKNTNKLQISKYNYLWS